MSNINNATTGADATEKLTGAPQKLNMSLEDVIALEIKKSSTGGARNLMRERRGRDGKKSLKVSLPQGKFKAREKVAKDRRGVLKFPSRNNQVMLQSKMNTRGRKIPSFQSRNNFFNSQKSSSGFTIMISGVFSISLAQLRKSLGVCGNITNVFFGSSDVAYVTFDRSTLSLKVLQDIQRNNRLGNNIRIAMMSNPFTDASDSGAFTKPPTPSSAYRAAGGSQQFNFSRRNPTAYSQLLEQRFNGMGRRFPYNNQNNTLHSGVQSGMFLGKDTIGPSSALDGISSPGNLFAPPSKREVGRISSHKTSSVIVSNAPPDLTASEIQDAFSCAGNIIMTEPLLNLKGEPTGRFTISFQHWEDAEDAVARFDGGELNDQRIRVFLE